LSAPLRRRSFIHDDAHDDAVASSSSKKNRTEGEYVMHSNAEVFKALAGIIGALAFFIVVIHQLTRLLG